MPRPRRSNIGRRSRHTSAVSRNRRTQSEEQRTPQNELQQLQRTRSVEQINQIRPVARRRQRIERRTAFEMEGAAFDYNFDSDYIQFGCIGAMDVRCTHCNALKFDGETPGMCCGGGKVKLPDFESPPEPLRSLIFGTSATSKHFLSHIRKYNAAFQMTSFGATKIVRDNFMPTFKVICKWLF